MIVTIGVPTNRLVKPKTAASLLNLVAHSQHDYKIVVSSRGFNTSENRNYIAAQAVKNGSEYLFFVDDDQIVPKDTLERLLARNKDIVGGVYMTKYEVQEPVLEYLTQEGFAMSVGDDTGLLEVGAIGTGCLLIKTDVFKKLKQPWFKYEWNDNGSIKRSHDWIFCEDARNAGYRVWADCSLDVKHVGVKEF